MKNKKIYIWKQKRYINKGLYTKFFLNCKTELKAQQEGMLLLNPIKVCTPFLKTFLLLLSHLTSRA